jgi:hypothetical protein
MKVTRSFAWMGLVLSAALPCSSWARVGGVDSGGGNTLIDSYIQDPTTFNEYKEDIVPLLAKIRSKNLFCFASAIDDRLHDATWYFVPSELKALTENITGVPFPSSQTAVQDIDNEEIWIDSNAYAGLDSDLERSKLLVHEALLGDLSSLYNPINPTESWVDTQRGEAETRGLVALFYSDAFSSMSVAAAIKNVQKFYPTIQNDGSNCAQ